MKSVTITDVFQFIVFIIVIPVITNVAISKAGGINELLRQLPADKLTVYKHEQFPRYLVAFLVWCLFPAVLSVPPVIQRILMARNRQQVTNMFFTTAAFLLVVRALVILSCLAVFFLAPDIKPSAGGAFAYVIHQYFHPALKGLSVAGLLAIVMSTLDSIVNAGGLLVTHNVLKPCFDKLKVAFDELQAVRCITFLMGCASILAAFSIKEVRLLSYFGMASFSSVITIPFIAGVLGIKTDTRSFLIATAVTITTFILANLYLPADNYPAAANYLIFPISLVANAISFFGTHYLLNRGFAVVKWSGGQHKRYIWHPSWQGLRKTLSNLLPTPQKLLRYSQDRVARYGANPTLFALFMSFNYMLPFFIMNSYADPAAYTWLLAIRGMGALLCVGLLLKPQWPARLRRYFPSYYHFCLLYCLPFVATFCFLLEGGV